MLMVSGSNMSGKSTLLRAVGLNVVLALAGAPVAAVARDAKMPATRPRAKDAQVAPRLQFMQSSGGLTDAHHP